VSIYFVVRKGWEVMETKLMGPRQEGLNIFVITGMGGCGKTQMVSYFAQKYHARYVYLRYRHVNLTCEGSNISSSSTQVQNRVSNLTSSRPFNLSMVTNKIPTSMRFPSFQAKPIHYSYSTMQTILAFLLYHSFLNHIKESLSLHLVFGIWENSRPYITYN
jgi:hypothetical protein